MNDWDAAAVSMADHVAGDLQAALTEAARARDRVYYDQAADTAARDGYYAGLDQAHPALQDLTALVTFTHLVQPRYKPAVEVYPWVDLHPDRNAAQPLHR